MEIIIKEDNLTISNRLDPDGINEITTEQVMLAAYDLISRIFGQRSVVNAYYRTDPDTMDVRDDDDEFFKYVKFFGYDDLNEG